jgi:hypothetical protein
MQYLLFQNSLSATARVKKFPQLKRAGNKFTLCFNKEYFCPSINDAGHINEKIYNEL